MRLFWDAFTAKQCAHIERGVSESFLWPSALFFVKYVFLLNKIANMNWKVMAQTMAFLFFQYPLLSTIPSIPHAFSVYLMNRYFPDFWYSHVTEKKTSEGRNAICEKSRTSCGNKVHYGNQWRNGWLSIWIITTLFFIDGHTKIRI